MYDKPPSSTFFMVLVVTTVSLVNRFWQCNHCVWWRGVSIHNSRNEVMIVWQSYLVWRESHYPNLCSLNWSLAFDCNSVLLTCYLVQRQIQVMRICWHVCLRLRSKNIIQRALISSHCQICEHTDIVHISKSTIWWICKIPALTWYGAHMKLLVLCA